MRGNEDTDLRKRGSLLEVQLKMAPELKILPLLKNKQKNCPGKQERNNQETSNTEKVLVRKKVASG